MRKGEDPRTLGDIVICTGGCSVQWGISHSIVRVFSALVHGGISSVHRGGGGGGRGASLCLKNIPNILMIFLHTNHHISHCTDDIHSIHCIRITYRVVLQKLQTELDKVISCFSHDDEISFSLFEWLSVIVNILW